MIKTYPSINALRNDYIATNAGKSRDYNSGLGWYGGETEETTLRLVETGDARLVASAERQLSLLDTAIETPRKQWERNVAGAFCSVPDVLAGLPTPMRRLREAPNETAPITIIFDVVCSASVSADIISRRGTTVLALAMALTRARPVELFAMACMDGYRDGTGETVFLAKINTSPLDLASACYVATSVAFARRLTYNLGRVHNDFGGGWPRGYRYNLGDKGANPYYADLQSRLGLDPKTSLIVPAARENDALLHEPVTWVQKQIDRFISQEEGTM